MIHYFSRFTSRAAILLALITLFYVGGHAQGQASFASVNYRLMMPRPASHLFLVNVEVELAQGSSTDYLDFQMPRWSPGRYAVFDFAKNVQEAQAAAGICPPHGR